MPTKVVLLIGVLLGIVIAVQYGGTERQMTHKCVRWETQVFEDFDGNEDDAEVCAWDVENGHDPGTLVVALNVPIRFFSGYTIYGASEGYKGSGRGGFSGSDFWLGVGAILFTVGVVAFEFIRERRRSTNA